MVGNFDFSNGYVVLRMICGAFFVPHIVGKITAREASVGFFKLAGFHPPQFWSYVSMAVEVVLAIALLLGVMTQFAAGLASVYLLIAAAANYKVSRKWLWHIGGSEWSVFWAICCAIVARFGTAV